MAKKTKTGKKVKKLATEKRRVRGKGGRSKNAYLYFSTAKRKEVLRATGIEDVPDNFAQAAKAGSNFNPRFQQPLQQLLFGQHLRFWKWGKALVAGVLVEVCSCCLRLCLQPGPNCPAVSAGPMKPVLRWIGVVETSSIYEAVSSRTVLTTAQSRL